MVDLGVDGRTIDVKEWKEKRGLVGLKTGTTGGLL